MHKNDSGEGGDPWSLLSRAENWYKIGLLNEAVVASDEAVETGLKELFNDRGVLQPACLEEAIRILEKEGMRFSVQSLQRLRRLRERAEQEKEDSLNALDVEEAISLAEDILSKIYDERESPRERDIISRSKWTHSRRKGAASYEHSREKEATPLLILGTLDSRGPLSLPSRGRGQGELEFFTRLLLARAILNFRNRRIPRLIGLAIAILSGAVCCLLAFIGGYGVILIFTGQSFFSIFGLVFDCILLFVSYFFLKVTIYVKSETR